MSKNRPAPRLVDPLCENLVEPLGIDVLNPRFTWRLDDPRPGAAQSAYRVIVSTGGEAV